jgi:sugar lactone lactonase YvrE
LRGADLAYSDGISGSLQVARFTSNRAEIGEGPIWHPGEQMLYWVDIARGVVNRSSDGTQVEAVSLPAPATCIVFDEHGALIGATGQVVGEIDLAAATLSALVTLDAPPDVGTNDGACDPRGRLLVGTADITGRRRGALYSVEHRVSRVLLAGVGMSNGLDWSVDGKTFFYVDSSMHRIDAFDYDLDTGDVANRRVVREFDKRDGLLDGLCIDAEDCLWVAFWGGGCIRRLTRTGEIMAVVSIPTPLVTSCCFGGRGYDRLFVTTAYAAPSTADDPQAGCVFEIDAGVPGRPGNAYVR